MQSSKGHCHRGPIIATTLSFASVFSENLVHIQVEQDLRVKMVQVFDGAQGSSTISMMESSEASDSDEKQFLMPNVIEDKQGQIE